MVFTPSQPVQLYQGQKEREKEEGDEKEKNKSNSGSREGRRIIGRQKYTQMHRCMVLMPSERERERERDRQTDRQTDRQRKRQRERTSTVHSM